MANSVSALNKQKYTKLVQALLEDTLVAMDLANTTLMADMPDGNTINFPRPEFQNVQSYTKYTDVTDQDLNFSNETLTINQTPIVTFVYDDVDNLDNGYDVVASAAPKAAYRIKQDIEGNFFNEYSNANSASAAPITLTTGASGNTVETYGNAYAQLVNDGVDSSNVVAVIDPFQLSTIGVASLGNTFKVADASFKKWFRGDFQNMAVIVSTNLTADYTLDLATNPTATNTVTFGGVVFTFVASPTLAGDVDIGSDANESATNLVAAINGTTPGTKYVELSTTDRAKMEGITATDGTDLITIESKRGYNNASTSMPAADNDFQAVNIHNMIMERGAINLVMKKEVSLKVQDVQKQLGTRYMTWARYGLKTFAEWAERMYDLQIVSQAAEA